MNVRWIQPDDAVGAQRDEIVVCIPVYGGHQHFVNCLTSVLAHTSTDVRILVCDDASPDPRSEELVRKLADAGSTEHEVLYLRRRHNVGFPANVNGAFALCAPADVVVLNSDCVVADGWLDGLREAAYVDSRVATATTLTNHGSVVSVPAGIPIAQLPEGWSLDEAAAAVRAASLRLRPRLPTAIGHCMFVRRSALQLVGDFDLAFSPGYGEEVDFCQRCLQSGLSHVVADDVLVFHHGGGSFSTPGEHSQLKIAHERIIQDRYPYYHQTISLIEQDVGGPLARVLGSARRALTGLSVAIDARILTGPMTGSQLHVLELIAALARTEAVRLTAIIPADLSNYAAELLASLGGIDVYTEAQARDSGSARADLVHRPFQVRAAEDLGLLARVGERLVVTNQDLIGYHNPTYFRSFDSWQGYRRLTRVALAIADRVAFFSSHARDDALAEDLVEPDRAAVVHIGVDHALTRTGEIPVAPRGAIRLPEAAEAILCIGTDFRHKNRIFALRMLDELQRRHDWPGQLVFVGPRVAYGSSESEEAEFLALHPRAAGAVVDFAAVTEAEKTWLFERMGLVVYPTVHEGFGLVPFEAADHGAPCMWSAGTSLSEVLPDAAATIVPWDAGLSADAALELLRDPTARERNLEAIRAAAGKLTWDATATALLDLYQLTCDAPATPAGAIERRHGLMRGELSDDAVRLVGPNGALPTDLERPLLALATHPAVGTPMFGLIKLGYRAAYRIGRRSSDNGGRRGPDASR